MFTRARMLGLALAGAVTLLLVGTGEAIVLHGKGELSASGSGLAVLDLRGVVKVHGAGMLIAEEDAVVEAIGHGRETSLGDGRVLYEGFGAIAVRSRHDRTRVEVAGTRLRLRARGVGVALLAGCGHFTTGDFDGTWGPDVEVEFDSEE